MDCLKYDVESGRAAVDHAVQEFPEYDSFAVAGYTPPSGSGPGYYTVLAFEDVDDRLDWEEEIDANLAESAVELWRRDEL